MNAHSFISELGIFFAVGGSEKDKAERFDKYATLIAEAVAKTKGSYNYQKLLKYIELNYDKMPPLKEILANLPIGIEYNVTFTGDEGKIIKRTYQGYEYEFTVVPSSWENVKTIAELDADINRRNGKNGDTE